MIAFATRGPGSKTVECARQRRDFAHATARVRIAEPKHAVRIHCRELSDVRRDSPYVAKAEPGDQTVAVAEGFAEQFAGVEEEDWCLPVDFGCHRKDHRGLGPK
jgi:hypothetical protein